jgi:hypothetical protein
MITVIIPHYYKEREKNLPEVVAGHKKVIVWNNNPEPIKGAINADRNYGGQLLRWTIGLLADTPYVLMIDNDIAVSQEAVANMLKCAKQHPGAIVGLFGKLLDKNNKRPYSNGTQYEGEEREVDVVLGRCVMVRRDFLPKILDVMIRHDSRRCDDLIASLVNKKAGNRNYIVPGKFKNLNEGSVGSWLHPDHFADRDNICKLFGDVYGVADLSEVVKRTGLFNRLTKWF